MLKDDRNLTKSLTETTYLDLPLETFKILDEPEETAEVIDLMSPGPLRDELRGTYDPSQESYEDYLRRQSIPQEERPLTGQTPTQQLFGIQRQQVNEGGVIGPDGMFTGEDLGTRQGFAELTPTQIKELKLKYPDWNDKYKYGFPKSDPRSETIRNIARKKQKLEYAKRPEVAAARREREKTRYQTDPKYREQILAKNRRNAAKLEQTLKRQIQQKQYYYTGGGKEKALARLKGIAIGKNYGSWMQNTDNALFKDMVRAAEQDANLKIIRGGPKNQIVGIKEGNKIYHPVGARREPVPGAPKNSVSIVKHPAFKQRAEINKAINTFANTKVPGFKNLTYKKALDAIQSQIAGTPLQNKNPAEFEHTKGVATDYKKGQLALRTANRDKELILSRLEQGLITKPVAIQELKNLGVRAYVNNKFIGAPKINVNKQLSDYKKYVDRMIKKDPDYFSELGQGKIPTRKINFLKEVEPIAGRLQKAAQGTSMYSFPAMLAEKGAISEAAEGAKLLAKGALKTIGPATGLYFNPTKEAAGYLFDKEKRDLSKIENRLGLESQLAFAPAVVSGTKMATDLIKNPAIRTTAERLLNLGMKAPTALKLARIANPVGTLALIGEGAYEYGKWAKKEIERIENMTPEEREAYNIAEQEQMGVAAAEGGIIRKNYAEAGLVDKLGRGAEAFDPRNLPYYGQKALKGLGEGVEMAVKFPVAAGSAIGTMMQEGPSKEIYQEFMNAMEPTATEYLSRKTGLTKMIEENEKRLMQERPGAVAMGNVLELGSTFVPPATGYVKLIEDAGSNLYKVLRNSAFGKPTDEKIVQQVADELSNLGVARRDFLKITGGASIYGLAKYLGLPTAVKVAEKVKPIRMLAKTSTTMPKWFPTFASRILDDADTVFKQIDEDIVEITNKNLPDLEINKYANGRWEISGKNEYGQRYAIDYEPPTVLEDGTKYPGDFTVMDSVPVRSGPDDVDFDAELVESIDDVLGGTSKLEEWTTGVKKKEPTKGEKRVIEAEGRAEADYDAWRESEDFVDE